MENKKIIITICVLIFVVVIAYFTLYINNNKITDEERKLQSHVNELNKYFDEDSYWIDDLYSTENDALKIVIRCDFDKDGIGEGIVESVKLIFNDYIGENGEYLYHKKIILGCLSSIDRNTERCFFEIDKDGVDVYLYTDAINLSTIAKVFPDINTMEIGDAYSGYLNPMWTEADFSDFQSIKELDYYDNWITNEDVDKISQKFPNCHIEQNTTLPY